MYTTLKEHDGRRHIGKGVRYDATVDCFRATADFETETERDAFVALFPKYVRVHASTCSTYDVKDSQYASYQIPIAVCSVAWHADNVNKGKNEQGQKRIRAFARICRENGIALTPNAQGFANAIEINPETV